MRLFLCSLWGKLLYRLDKFKGVVIYADKFKSFLYFWSLT